MTKRSRGRRVSSLRRIQAAREALRARLGRIGMVPPGGDLSIEAMEGVQAAVMTEVHAEARHILARRLQALMEAEARVRDGGYGVCEACGDPIPVRRLAVLPEARHCVACAEAAEARGSASGRWGGWEWHPVVSAARGPAGGVS